MVPSPGATQLVKLLAYFSLLSLFSPFHSVQKGSSLTHKTFFFFFFPKREKDSVNAGMPEVFHLVLRIRLYNVFT